MKQVTKNYTVKINGEFKDVFPSLKVANQFLMSYRNVNADQEFDYEIVREVTATYVVRLGSSKTITGHQVAKSKEGMEVVKF